VTVGTAPLRIAGEARQVVIDGQRGLGTGAVLLTGEAVGFGSDTVIPNPLKAQIKLLLLIFDVTQQGVQTFRANLQICRDQRRDLEFQVARCIELVDFVMPSKRDDVYELVVDIVNKAEEEGVSVSNARKSLERAEKHRLNMRWKEAYLSLCDAYQKIGA
jgi:hypothetical protein